MSDFGRVVTSASELRDLIGHPSELAVRKQRAALDEHTRAFIACSPFVLIATANAAGQCDVSPKGDAPGFVLVLDDTHVLVPDRPGNRRLDGMRNILDNPHAGLIFLVPGKEETLRVNGRASIVVDEALLGRCTARGKRPALGIGVEIEEVFMHCAKAFRRSRLWDPAEWIRAAELASLGRVLWDQTRPEGQTVEELERHIEDGYVTRLY